MNAGRAALLRLLRDTRVVYVAARLEVSVSTVYKWTEGYRKPSERSKRLLAVNYQIPARLWALDRQSTTRSRR